MRKIISSINIGNSSIKLVVGEMFENRLHILSASKITNHGIEKGKIVDEENVINAVKKAIEEASNSLGVKIEKCILGLDMINARLAKSANAIKIKNELHEITAQDIQDLMSKTKEGQVPADYVLVSTIPVEFTIDNNKIVKNPLGITSENLGLKAIIVSLPKDYVSTMLDIANKSGLKVIDVVPLAVGDYYTFKNNETSKKIGAIINLGSEISTISIFNKGIITNTKIIPLGAANIIKDISYINDISEGDSRAIFQDIGLASPKLATPNEYRIISNLEGKEIKLDQYVISEIVASRIEEILKLAKKQTNILTKKEISYIIVTGGLTELRDFNLILEDSFGKDATIGKMNFLGARDNSFSSTIGIIKYFDEKLELKGKTITMINEKGLSSYKEENTNSGSLLGKVFGYFFDN